MDKSTVTPYVAAKGADRFLDFVEAVFTSEKAGRVGNPDGTVGHAEIRIGAWGGRIKDPVGNVWWVQTEVEQVDEATMLARFADPAELAIMRRVQDSFDQEMRRRC